mgnify:CR=1 FL=1
MAKERQCKVYKMYYWDGMTQKKIGKKLGLDRVTVTQYIQNSLEKLRKCIKIDDLIDF